MEAEVETVKKELTGLPKGWSWRVMEDVADVIGGATPKTGDPEHYEGGNIAWLTPADLSGYTEKYIEQGARFITKKGLESCSTKLLPKGTVLFTSRAPIGYVAIASGEVCTNQGFKSFVLDESQVTSDYVYWWLKGAKSMAEEVASGTTFLELSTAKAKKLPIPVAPLPEQRRIVEAIERQLGRLDEAVSRLQAAKAKLKRYKQAVLKAAVEGEEWETVPLRDLIQEGRKIAYGVLKPGPHVPDGVRFIKSGQVRDGVMDLSEDYRISKDLDEEFHRTRLQGGEVLLNLVGASIGRSAVAPDELKGANVTRAIAVIPVVKEKAHWVQLVLNTPYGQEHMLGKTGGNAQPVLNLAVVKDIPVPLPSPIEMKTVVAKTRERLSAMNEMDSTLDAQLLQATRLRQAVLKRAFEGRLV